MNSCLDRIGEVTPTLHISSELVQLSSYKCICGPHLADECVVPELLVQEVLLPRLKLGLQLSNLLLRLLPAPSTASHLYQHHKQLIATGCRPHLPSPSLQIPKPVRTQITHLLPTGIGERYSQTYQI
jgi:hypothetical protein